MPVDRTAAYLFPPQPELTPGQKFADELVAQTIPSVAEKFVSRLTHEEAGYLYWELAVRYAEPGMQIAVGESTSRENVACCIGQYITACTESLQPEAPHEDTVLHDLQAALHAGPTDTGVSIANTREIEAGNQAEQLAQYQLFAMVTTVLALKHAINNKRVHAKLTKAVEKDILSMFDGETRSDHLGRSLAQMVLRQYHLQYERPHARHSSLKRRKKAKPEQQGTAA